MKTSQMIGFKSLVAIFMVAGLVSTQAQSTTWIGPASGGEWNTSANWDAGAPRCVATNAFIGSTTNVNYNLPMSATTFGTLTNWGTLNVNTNGFNNTGIVMIRVAGGNKLFVNTGGVVNVTGAFAFCSNAVVTMSAGSSLTVNGALLVGSGQFGGTGSGTPGGFGIMTNNGGTLSASSTSLNVANGSVTTSALLVINGGTNNLGTTSIKRSSAGSTGFNALGTEGLVIYGGLVTTTNMNVGGGSGNSFLSAYVAGGTVTNIGSLFINQGTSARGSRLHQTGGLFVVPDPGVVNPNPTVAGTLNNYVVLGGTNIVGGFFLGNSNSAAGTVNVTNGATMYIGSQGIASNGAVIVNVALNGGGLLGAMTPWTGSVPMKLNNGGTFTFQTADINNTPNNITLTAPLSGTGNLLEMGGGTLTLGGANTYSGNTIINAGTLALSAGITMTTPRIFVGSGTILDVSQVSGFTLNAAQTLSGSGTVNGAVTAAANAVIFPGSNSVTGTLTFNNGLTENGGANNQFNLNGNPAGPGNDFMNVSGGLVLSGANTVTINGALQTGSAYPLFGYNGNLTGGIGNLTVSGATGILSNSVASSIIYFVAQASVRGSTNVTWVGNPLNNVWDVELATNWLNGAALDFFVPNDTVLFSNLGASNSQVNLPGTVMPSVMIVNTTSNYTLLGNGAIGGTAGIIVSNGTVNVLTTNTYTGTTILDGGILLTPLIANSGSPSGIGASSIDPANLVFNGGTLAYDGVSVGTDHGITLTNTGGTIDVTNGATLTLNGTIFGNGGLTLIDSGTLTLAGNNNYSGNTTIKSGTLNLNNVNGAGTGTIIFSGGTLGLVLSAQQTYPNNVTVISNSTINSAGGNNNIINGAWTGSNVTLTVNNLVTNGTFSVGGSMTNFYGTVELGADTGFFRFNAQNSNTQFGAPNTIFDLGTSNATLEARNPGTIAVGTLVGGPNTFLTGPSGVDGALIWQLGGNTNAPNATFYGKVQNISSARNSGIDKIGNGTTTLAGQNTYTGTTTVDSGVLALTNNPYTSIDGSIANSASIIINAGGILDVIGRSDGTMPINAGQVLSGVGTLHGTLSTSGSGIVSPGGGIKGAPGTLTVNGTVNLGGTAWMKLSPGASPNSDRLVATGGNAINYGGTLVVTNVGAAFHAGETFTLFTASARNSGFTLVLPHYYTWDTSQLNVNGSITLTAVLPPPSFTGFDISQLTSDGLIFFSATNGSPNSVVNILTTTNLSAPLSTWTVLTQTSFNNSGIINQQVVEVNPALPTSYYVIQAQP